MKRLVTLGIVILLGGCSSKTYEHSIAPMLDMALQSQGVSSQMRSSISKVGTSVVKSFEDITPEQEYYIGRSVSANLLGRYRPYKNRAAEEYVSTIGRLLSYGSDQPATFGGYHFMILDSDEINAFAAPGGFVFVTRGMLRCATSEDAVAAILAHEIAHVTLHHGMRSIKSSRWTSVGTLLASEGVKNYSRADVAQLVSSFEGSIDDVIGTMVVSGYSRSYELEADQRAVAMMSKLGYDPSALKEMLSVMDNRLKPGNTDFASTHPDPKVRIEALENVSPVNESSRSIRIARFQRALAKI